MGVEGLNPVLRGRGPGQLGPHRVRELVETLQVVGNVEVGLFFLRNQESGFGKVQFCFRSLRQER